MRTLLFSMLIAGGLTFAGGQAVNAAPANGLAVSGAGQTDTLTLVRDGCGRGRHFSKWRGVCVWDTPPRPRYYAPPAYGYGYYGPPAYGYGYGPGYYGPGYYRPGFGIGIYRGW
jgi:hypothetical protein